MRPSSPAPVTRPLHATLPSQSASSALQNLLILIAKITADDINTAQQCAGGAFGDVYVLNHPSIGKLALKHMRAIGNKQEAESQMRRATREAETWRKLTHGNILPFLDVLERSGQIYLVAPFVQNGSLIGYIHRHPNVDRARLIHETAAGIAYLHRRGIIHGDIKGANILVSDDVRALICDFGLAREEQNNTSAGLAGAGTIRWKSPELFRGERKSFESDIWAFAMTICEILTGRVPYHQYESQYAVIAAVAFNKERPRKEPLSSPTGISYASLWEVAGDCWHEDPDQRPEIQEAYDRLIFGGFRSLLLSSPPEGSTDPSNHVQVALSQSASPQTASSPTTPQPTSSDTLVNARAPYYSGLPGTSLEEATTITLVGPEPIEKFQQSMDQDIDNQTAITVRRRSLPKDGVIGRHGKVYSVGFSPDGKIIATGSDDHTLCLWDGQDGVQAGKPLGGHTGRVSCLAFSPAGNTLASGSHDNTLQLWDVASGYQKSKLLKGHTKGVTCLAFSPNGTIIASCSMDNTIRFWDPKTGNPGGKVLKGHTLGVFCLAFSPDGTTIASGSGDKTIRLWGVGPENKKCKLLKGHSKAVTCLAFSSDGNTIASGSWDKSIRLWDAVAGSPKGEQLNGHADVVECLSFSPDGRTIASGSGDKTIRLWDVETPSQMGEPLEGHTDVVRCLSFSPDGMNIISGSSDGTLRLWDAFEAQPITQGTTVEQTLMSAGC